MMGPIQASGANVHIQQVNGELQITKSTELNSNKSSKNSSSSANNLAEQILAQTAKAGKVALSHQPSSKATLQNACAQLKFSAVGGLTADIPKAEVPSGSYNSFDNGVRRTRTLPADVTKTGKELSKAGFRW